jgi:hypothetical protein
MAILRKDKPPEPALFQSDTPIRTSVESTDLTGRDVRPLDRTGRRSGARSVMPSVAGADVVIVVVDCVDGRLLRGRRTAVDSGVVCDQVGLAVRLGSLILGSQPACPGVRAVIEEEPVHVLIPRVLVPGDV